MDAGSRSDHFAWYSDPNGPNDPENPPTHGGLIGVEHRTRGATRGEIMNGRPIRRPC